MSTKQTGGPAFPVPGLQDHEEFNGMSLRDYFATHASEADVAAQGEVIRLRMQKSIGCGVLPDGWRTEARYMHADAMLAARESAQ